MRALNALIKKEGFSAAVKNFDYEGMRFDYAENYSRADFIPFLPASIDATVLDLGSGYGNITIPLARKFKKVIATDASLELLEFLNLRAQGEGIQNIECVNIASLEHGDLPFQQKSFDVIILNGVLEWVGSGKTEKDPGVYQQELLNALAGLLKDDGVLYIAIENRLFPGWLRRDPHSKLKWTSMLPRPIADWYARRKGHKNGYRTYIYSKHGYKKLLSNAGFTNTKFYYPYSSYRDPEFIYGDDLSVKRKLFNEGYAKNIFTSKWYGFLQVIRHLGLENSFLSSFMIMAKKDKGSFVPDFIRQKGFGEHENCALMKIVDRKSKERTLWIFEGDSANPVHQETMEG
ncbi:MAG: hypothetical protein A2591_02525 [Candidatus Yonathbacteria bacterium RIFOXYD1_FULL_52_36]|uniref:Uncharacterized protein n=1 Tax=Candidatus Yonathbacteria bacterium RIFOXYD1_FULL_52_36 TaxID=1802730 RepID=A0A1G2SKS3_9BACT|nr:MAG: hypothetical protein A2591_02525 [Candidatus Yonathbacteria bacterium RIFOXYD1_FULL_52_36]